MNLRLITIILLLTVSCQTQTSGWQTLDFGMFKLKTPQGWKKFEEKIKETLNATTNKLSK